MPKVSVIVPVYGVEKYIERCARSLFEQTLDDIEYLFVDDCTPDQSIEILKQVLADYPQRSPQVTIHRMAHNSGQAKVREWGIRNATGDFVIHCDSDDWVDRDMYRLLYEKAMESGADMVVCDYYEAYEDHQQQGIGCRSLEREQLIKNFCTLRCPWAVWNKLIKTALFRDEHLVFPQGNMGEDMALLMQIVLKTDKVAYIPKPLYYYFCNPLSITQTYTEEVVCEKYKQLKRNAELLFAVFDKAGLTHQYRKELLYVKYEVRWCLWPITKSKAYRKLWRQTYPELFPAILFSPYIEAKQKAIFLLTYLGVYPRH